MAKPRIFQQMEEANTSFYAIFNQTTYNEIKNAYDAGKAIGCKYNGSISTNFINSESAFFFVFIIQGEGTKMIHINSNNVWTAEEVTAFVLKSGATMDGSLIAANGLDNSRQMRNISLSSEEPSGGQVGDIWIKYE